MKKFFSLMVIAALSVTTIGCGDKPKPVTPPVTDPVTPPVTDPVTPPVTDPVK